MSKKIIKITVFRFDPSVEKESTFRTYKVPWKPGMSVMDSLDYIYQNVDSTLAYYDHAGCSLGICGKCTGRINGKPGLFCQTLADGDLVLEPLKKDDILKDLVTKTKKASKQTEDNESIIPGGANMVEDINSVNMLVRREIESLIAGPMINAFSEEFGKEKTENVIKTVIRELALESGRMLAAFTGGNGLEDLKKGLPLFAQGGALELELLEADSTKISMNITRCRYAEMYKANKMEEYGYLLSCGRDYALIEGFNPEITLTRTQTIMEGASHCDFCFSIEKG